MRELILSRVRSSKIGIPDYGRKISGIESEVSDAVIVYFGAEPDARKKNSEMDDVDQRSWLCNRPPVDVCQWIEAKESILIEG